MTFALAILIAVGLLLFVIRFRKGGAACRWKADADGDKGSLRKFRCATCGAEAFTATKGLPSRCFKGQKKGGL